MIGGYRTQQPPNCQFTQTELFLGVDTGISVSSNFNNSDLHFIRCCVIASAWALVVSEAGLQMLDCKSSITGLTAWTGHESLYTFPFHRAFSTGSFIDGITVLTFSVSSLLYMVHHFCGALEYTLLCICPFIG